MVSLGPNELILASLKSVFWHGMCQRSKQFWFIGPSIINLMFLALMFHVQWVSSVLTQIEAEIIWLPFCRWHFEIHFLEWKSYFDLMSLKFVSTFYKNHLWFILQESSHCQRDWALTPSGAGDMEIQKAYLKYNLVTSSMCLRHN